MTRYCKVIFILNLVVSLGCQQSSIDNADVLAQAYGATLSMNDLDKQLTGLSTYSDSSFVINQAVDQWLMDRILHQEAKKKLTQTKNIDALVEDYRNSLLIHEYEKLIISENLNTEISQAEIDTFYNKFKKDFVLKEDIVRSLHIKIPKNLDNDSLKTLWKTEDLPGLKTYLSKHQTILHLDPDFWINKRHLSNIFPESLIKKINFDRTETYSQEDGNFKFYVKILDRKKAGEDAPVNQVKHIIQQRILHNRSERVLKKKRKELFNKSIENKNISIKTKYDS